MVALQDRDHVVTATGTGHGGGAFGLEGLEDLLAAIKAADVAGADARLVLTVLFAGKVVVEGDRAEELGEGDLEPLADHAKGILGEVAVAVVKGVQRRQERGVLVLPMRDDFLVSHR